MFQSHLFCRLQNNAFSLDQPKKLLFWKQLLEGVTMPTNGYLGPVCHRQFRTQNSVLYWLFCRSLCKEKNLPGFAFYSCSCKDSNRISDCVKLRSSCLFCASRSCFILVEKEGVLHKSSGFLKQEVA